MKLLFDFPNAFRAAVLLGLGVLASAQTAAPPPSPTPTPAGPAIQFPSAVELVTGDAVGTDKKNNHIENLTR